MRINPVYKKELKLNTRSFKLPLMILIYNAVLITIAMVIFYSVNEYVQNSATIKFDQILMLYTLVLLIEFLLLFFMVPVLTANTISGERERQTLDILLSSKMTPYNIVWGKLGASINTIVLLIVSSLPVLSIIFVFGGIRVSDLMLSVGYLIFAAIFIGSVGIFFSVTPKRSTTAMVSAYVAMLLVVGGTILIVYLAAQARMLNSDYRIYDPGMATAFLLINPAITLMSIVQSQLGSFPILYFNSTIFEGLPDWMSNNWIALSIIAQFIVLVLLLFVAPVRLNPVKKLKKGKKLEKQPRIDYNKPEPTVGYHRTI